MESVEFNVSTSFQESRPLKQTEKLKYDYQWLSITNYIVIALCYCLTPDAFKFFNQNKHEPDMCQEIFALLFICLPVLYMQISLGKYTQNSIMNLQYMIPIAKGLGYMFIINVAISTVKSVYYMTDTLLYFLLSFQLNLPWAKCLNTTNYQIEEQCYDGKKPANCTVGVNCELAAKLFWTYIYMDNPTKNSPPVLQRFVTSWLSWLLIFAIVNIACYRRNRVFFCLEILFTICFVLMLVGVLFAYGSSLGISLLFNLHTVHFLNLSKWVAAVTKTSKFMSLGQTFHIMSGARMQMSISSDIWCIVFLIVLIFVGILYALFTHSIFGIGELNTGHKTNAYGYISTYDILFVYVPGYLSFLSAPQCWCLVFFLGVTAQLIINATCRLLSILFSITNHVPYMMKYRIYLLALFCSIGAITGSIMLPGSKFNDTLLFLNETTSVSELMAATFQSIFVFWIYSVQTLGDDIHYILGRQPARFWKVCWYVSPIVYSFATIHNLYTISRNRDRMLFKLGTIFATASPVFIFAAIQFFVYLKQRRILDLLQPEVEWGVPDPEERLLRHSFNPRKEIRSKIRRYQCQHKCLVGSKMHKLIFQMESEERKEVFDEDYLRVKRILD